MKILSKEQFMEMPYGTLYRTCINSAFSGDLTIKSEERGCKQSWWALDISPWLENECETLLDKLLGSEIETEEFCTDDAVYNYDDQIMYAVFSKQEIAKMIERMKSATGY